MTERELWNLDYRGKTIRALTVPMCAFLVAVNYLRCQERPVPQVCNPCSQVW